MEPSWHFLSGGTGRVSSEGMADPLRNTDLKPEELLVRESLQNSIDETIRDGNGLTFRIEAKKLEGAEKLNFISKLKFNDIKIKSESFDRANNWYKRGLESLRQFDDPDTPLRILQISDHNANGLGGKWNIGQSIKDRFFNLVLSITKTKKQEEVDGDFLGSYGFGKMVFALSSDLRTMLYYSHFPKDERSGEDEKRLMASAFLPSFFEQEPDELEFTGQAYFGLASEQDNNPRKPITNDDADAFFKDLGFKPREQGDYGTTIIVPDCSLKIADLGKAVEKWWWPLLMQDSASQKLTIELIEDDGATYEVNPQSREDLFPFISAANNAKDNFSASKKAETKEIKINVANNDGIKKNRNPGKLSNLRLSKGSEIEFQNKVAIVRDNLVIEYWDAFREEGHAAVGVFFVSNSDKEGKKIVTYSEPPAHDKLSANHNRLIDNFGKYGSDYIRLTKNQIQEKSRDFQTTLEQTSTDKNTDALSFLDDLLGPLIKPRKKGTGPAPASDPRIQTIQKEYKVFSKDGNHFSEIQYTLGLVNEADIEEMDFDLLLTCSILKDDVQVKDKALKVTVIKEDQETVIEPGQIQKVTLKKSSKFKGLARVQYHRDWIINWGLSLDKSELAE